VNDIDNMISRLTERQRHEFALACARRVQRLMTDQRSIAALDTRERWLRGDATDEEMAAAWSAADAARSAAWSAANAAWAAALAAAWAPPWSAAWAAARDSAWAAASAAADSARSAAWVAADAVHGERAWQRAELEQMIQGGGA
jgi:hypothetical protein